MGHDFCNKLFFITRGKFDTSHLAYSSPELELLEV
jgi:hypothetical protein